MITGHGDDAYLYEDIRMDFSSNIYSHADLSELKAYLHGRMDVIGHYPEPEAATLEREIAKQRGVPAECVIVTNGATDAIYLVAQAMSNSLPDSSRGNEKLFFKIKHPTFSEYGDACRMFGMEETEKNRLHTFEWVCNPNNPTGEVTEKAEVLHMAHENALVVVDQSYEDYTLEELMTPSEAIAAGNIIQIFSLTKTYAVPGLRIGYVIASPEWAARLRRNLRPWSVNALAIEAGSWLTRHQKKAVSDIETYLKEAQRLRTNLLTIEGVEVLPTATHFMLCRMKGMTARELKDSLARKHHVLIRDASNFEGLDEYCFRIAAQSPEENDLLVKVMTAVNKK